MQFSSILFGMINKNSYLCDMEIISRNTYINHIMRYINKGMMIALTGQRRVGKSYILRQIAETLSEKDPDANII